MRILAAATAALVIASGVSAADGKKKGFTNAWPPKKVQFNPKELTVDKTVPWQKDGSKSSQKVEEKYRILGEKDMAVGTIRRIDPELGLVEIQTDGGVAAGYMYFKDAPIVGESKPGPTLTTAASKAKFKGAKLKSAVDGPNRSKSGGRIKFNEFTIKKTTDAAPIAGTYAELVKLKGLTVMVTTSPNTPILFQALVTNEQ